MEHHSNSPTCGTGWKVFECPGVEPVFSEERQALNYAKTRAGFSSIEIRIVDSAGNIVQCVDVAALSLHGSLS
jgi:hypothetical protein